MSQGRRHFTDEFKREAVSLLVSSGRPLSRIAGELGISASMPFPVLRMEPPDIDQQRTIGDLPWAVRP
jgi:hypothetical protein